MEEKKEGKISSATAKDIAYIALFTAMAVVVNMLSFDTGVKFLKITFVYFILFLVGVAFKPATAFVIGFLADAIGFLLKPDGVYLPLLSVSNGLYALIFSAGIRLPKLNVFIKVVISFVVGVLVCTSFLSTYALYLVYNTKKLPFFPYLWLRFPFQLVVASINMAIALVFTALSKRNKFLSKNFSQLI